MGIQDPIALNTVIAGYVNPKMANIAIEYISKRQLKRYFGSELDSIARTIVGIEHAKSPRPKNSENVRFLQQLWQDQSGLKMLIMP